MIAVVFSLNYDPLKTLDAGTGQKIGTNKEKVDFGNVIGKYVNPETSEAVDTTIGIIHYIAICSCFMRS